MAGKQTGVLDYSIKAGLFLAIINNTLTKHTLIVMKFINFKKQIGILIAILGITAGSSAFSGQNQIANEAQHPSTKTPMMDCNGCSEGSCNMM